MTSERYEQIRRLYHAALELPAHERETFLAQACGHDSDLYLEVKELLVANDQAEGFIETPALEIMAATGGKYRNGIAIGQTIAQYRVLSGLGRGGMGEVYLAEDTKLGRKVALKLLPLEFTHDPERISRFEQEARATSALNHPHILTIYDINEVDGIRFIATEYVEGETLRQRMDRAALGLRQALEVAIQIVSALAAAHEAGILHRDIKPENLMMRPDDYVKVLDFGLAKLMEVSRPDKTAFGSSSIHTLPGLIVGTLGYMSPEQLKGAELDGRSDLFSGGVVLYEMTTGVSPFKRETMAETVAAILQTEPLALHHSSRDIPAELDRIVRKALAKVPSERYPNAKSLLTDLKNLSLELEVQARLQRAAATDRQETAEPRNSQHNLPVQLTSFVGREAEIRALKQMVPDIRLITLIGAGGCGKTRLALQTASQLQPSFPDGVWFIDLAPVNDASMVLRTVAAVLRLREDANVPLMHTITNHLKDGETLLLFDNCEHLLEACAGDISHLLKTCPNLRVLATSREPLAIAGETVRRVGSLSVPAEDVPATSKKLMEYEAVRLFMDRSRSFDTAFKISSKNADAVAHICRYLDGIPLALELAAARVRTLSISVISSHLQDAFSLLTTGSRGSLPRHRTLRAAIEWSYNLLSATERTVFSRCSVFTASWTLEAAEAVCAGGDVLEKDVLSLMCNLVDKSLVVTESRQDELRYRFLSTIGQFAAQMLVARKDDKMARFRHAAFFLDLAGAAEEKLGGSEQIRWLTLLENEHDNIRSAMVWSLENDTQKLLSATRGLHQFWLIHGHFGEGRAWLERVLVHPKMNSMTFERAQALRQAGVMAFRQGDYAGANRLLNESLDIGKKLNDTSSVASAKSVLGVLALQQDELATAGDLWHEALSLFRDLNDKRGVAHTLLHLGVLARRQSDYNAARERYQEALQIFDNQGNNWGSAACIHNLASLARYQEDYRSAGALALRGLLLRKELLDRRGIVDSLELLAALRLKLEKYRESVCQWAVAEKLRRHMNSPLSPAEQEERRSDAKRATEALGSRACADAWEKGAAMSVEEMIAFALGLSFSDRKRRKSR